MESVSTPQLRDIVVLLGNQVHKRPVHRPLFGSKHERLHCNFGRYKDLYHHTLSLRLGEQALGDANLSR